LRLGWREGQVALVALGYGLLFAALMVAQRQTIFGPLVVFAVSSFVYVAVAARVALIGPAVFGEGWRGIGPGWGAGGRVYVGLFVVTLGLMALNAIADHCLYELHRPIDAALGSGFVGPSRREQLELARNALAVLDKLVLAVEVVLMAAARAAAWQTRPENKLAPVPNVVEVF